MSKTLQIVFISLLTFLVALTGWLAYEKVIREENLVPVEPEMVISEENCAMIPTTPGCEIYNVNEGTGMTAMITGIESYLFEMIPHHQEAVDSSLIFIKKTLFLGDELNPLQTIAQNIISGQVVEIDQLKGWISTNFSGSEYVSHYMPMMNSSDEDMTIPALQKMYAQDMIVHHQGAIDMSEKLLDLMKEEDKVIRVTEEGMKFRNEIKTFAQQVIDTQTVEIKRMQDILANVSLTGSSV